MFFKFKQGMGGSHTETINGELITYESKDNPVIESNSDLSKSLPDKFEKTDAPKKSASPKTEAPADEDSEEFEDERGENVTEKYKAAIDTDFQIFKTDEGLFVADPYDPESMLNDEPLKGGQIASFIRKQLTDEE